MLKRHYFAPGVIERQAHSSSPLRGAILALAKLALLACALGLIAGLFVGWASP